MSRGNRGEPIFKGEADCELFIQTLEEACTKTGWLIHAFALMGNHYHLLLETPEANLVAGMKWLQGTYTQRFNARHKLWGHLLQGRYKALIVEGGGGYFSAVSSYIHLNPVRARCFDLKQEALTSYRWSSYPLYLDPPMRPDWLRVDRVLGEYGLLDDGDGRKNYAALMQGRVAEVASGEDLEEVEAEWGRIRRGWFLGSEQFRDELLGRIDDSMAGKRRESFHGESVRQHDEDEAAKLLAKGLALLDISLEDFPEMKKGADEKAVLAWLLRKRTTVSRSWVAEHLCIGDESRVSRLCKAVESESRLKDLRGMMEGLS